jgi:hypothetical protein
MNLTRKPMLLPSGRHKFQWNRKFCLRRRHIYDLEDQKLLENPASTEALLEVFFDEERDDILNPRCYNYVALKDFLQRADLQQLTIGRPILALIDDRQEQTDESNRNWESEKYARRPPRGHNVNRLVLDEGDLFRKLNENVRHQILFKLCLRS